MVEIESKGLLIAIEGIDAVGKRTQCSLLEGWLQSRKLATISIAFPDYTTPLGGELKKFLSSDKYYSLEVGHMLFAANRWERKQDIEMWLSEGKIVVVNRYTGSNLAYGLANGLSLRWLENLEKGLPKANVVILLDADPESLTLRKKKKDRYEIDKVLQEKARKAYLQLAKKFGWVVLDANKPIREVHLAIINVIEGLTSKRPIQTI